MSYKPFKMKGHTLPGIKQMKSNKTSDGRAGSSAFQKKGCKSPYKNVEEGYNPDGSIDKNSERYKKAMANTKKSDARKAKENELRGTMKTGTDVQKRKASTKLASKSKISAGEKRRRDAEGKKRKTGAGKLKNVDKTLPAKKLTRKRQVDGEQVTASKASGGMFKIDEKATPAKLFGKRKAKREEQENTNCANYG